jgi:hypothetical protein
MLASRAACALVALACVALASRHAAAETHVEPTAVEYHAPASCPDESAFLAAVRARTARFQRVERDATRTFIVVVSRGDDRGTVRGRLDVIDASGARTTREFTGDTCENVLGALALISALAIDPNASTAPVPSAAAPPTVPGSSPTSVPPSEPPSAPPSEPRSERPSAPPILTLPSAPPPAREAVAPTPRRALSWWLDVGVGITVTGAVAPEPLVGAMLFAEAGMASHALFAPSVRVGTAFSPDASFGVPNVGAATFRWTAGFVEACPVRWLAGALSFTPCARADAGGLHGQGSGIAHSTSDTRLWIDIAAMARGRWAPSRAVFIEFEAGALVPLTRDRFHFAAPDVTIHEAPAVGAMGAVAAGVHFW